MNKIQVFNQIKLFCVGNIVIFGVYYYNYYNYVKDGYLHNLIKFKCFNYCTNTLSSTCSKYYFCSALIYSGCIRSEVY